MKREGLEDCIRRAAKGWVGREGYKERGGKRCLGRADGKREKERDEWEEKARKRGEKRDESEESYLYFKVISCM